MSRINTVPKGLQSFLGNTNFGDNPSEIATVAAPTVDLSQFLQVDQIRSYASGLILQNAPTVQLDTITVPENELWFLFAAGIKAEATAASQDFGLTVRVKDYPANEDSSIGERVPLFPLTWKTVTQDQPVHYIYWLPEPFPVPSNCEIDWYWEYEDTGTSNWQWRTYLWYYALKV